MSLMVAALVPALPVVAAYLQAVSKSAGKLIRPLKEESPGRACWGLHVALVPRLHKGFVARLDDTL